MTKTELIQSQNLTTLTVAALISLISSPEVWPRTTTGIFTSVQYFCAWAFLTFGIFTAAALFQVVSVRKLGPGLYGSFSSVRVLVAVVGSYVMMAEPVKNWMEWSGILLIVITMSAYLRYLSQLPK